MLNAAVFYFAKYASIASAITAANSACHWPSDIRAASSLLEMNPVSINTEGAVVL